MSISLTRQLLPCMFVPLSLSALAEDHVHIRSQRQLFLDDYIIEHIHGLKRTMHQPDKKGL